MDWIISLHINTNLLQDHNLVGCLQVLQLVGDQDPRLVLQEATDAPDGGHNGGQDLAPINCVSKDWEEKQILRRCQCLHILHYGH